MALSPEDLVQVKSNVLESIRNENLKSLEEDQLLHESILQYLLDFHVAALAVEISNWDNSSTFYFKCGVNFMLLFDAHGSQRRVTFAFLLFLLTTQRTSQAD
jgi:hypothetical protein